LFASAVSSCFAAPVPIERVQEIAGGVASAVQVSSASGGKYAGYVEVKWSTVSGATSYKIGRGVFDCKPYRGYECLAGIWGMACSTRLWQITAL